MVVQKRVLHDGFDVTVVSGRLLSVPFDESEGYRAPAVTQATDAASAAATPYTVRHSRYHQLHSQIGISMQFIL